MKITLELLKKRHSVRSYATEPISDKLIKSLQSELTFINTHEAGLNFRLCIGDKRPFDGFRRSYGMFRNVSNYLTATIDESFPDALERAGYFAEQFVIKCTDTGLGTCFVGGTFSRKDVGIMTEIYEKIPFVVAFGYPDEEKTSFIGKFSARLVHRNSKSPRDFYEGDENEYKYAIKNFKWLPLALEALACAPSAVNRRPVRLKMTEVETGKAIKAFTITKGGAPIDLGIAKYNIASVVGGEWEWGENGIFIPDIQP